MTGIPIGPIMVGASIPTVGIILAFLGLYAYRQHWPMIIAKTKGKDDKENIPLTKEDVSIIPTPRPQSKLYTKPLTIARILADDIKPDKEEYAALKDQDMRLHTLKFSQSWGKKFSSLNIYPNDPEGKQVSLNRFVLTLYSISYI